MDALSKNWKTTLIGLAGGAFNLFLNGANWKTVVASVLMAAFGIICKDFNVTNVPTLPVVDLPLVKSASAK